MSHLRLVPPLAETRTAAPARSAEATAGTSWGKPQAHATPYHDPKVALLFFQAASGLCLCRECSMRRHPAYGVR